MLRCISVFFVVFICWACEVDYSFGEKDFKPRVVVNALISPQEPFAVRLHWSRSYSAQSGFTPVGEAEIRLYEDNTEVVRCPADPEGTTRTTFRAAAGRFYRLVGPRLRRVIRSDDDSRSTRSPHIVRAPKGMVSAFRHDGPYCRRGCQSYLAPGYGTGQ